MYPYDSDEEEELELDEEEETSATDEEEDEPPMEFGIDFKYQIAIVFLYIEELTALGNHLGEQCAVK